MSNFSPLNLQKEITVIEGAINSLLEMGRPTDGTRFWAKVEILKDRLAMMKDGTGFTAGYSHVSDKDADTYIIAKHQLPQKPKHNR